MQPRAKMFEQTPTIVSLADILGYPANYNWKNIYGDAALKIYFENTSTKTNVTCVISDISDFNIPEFTLVNLVRLDHLYRGLGCSLITILKTFFRKLQSLPSGIQEQYLQQFYGNTSYDELHAISPYMARIFMRLLLDDREDIRTFTSPNFRGMQKAPTVLLQFADHLARSQVEFPAVLLQKVDMMETITSLCRHDLVAKSVRKDIKVEGSFGLQPANAYVYELAKQKDQNGALSPADLEELKQLILQQHTPGRYPIPEPTSWEGKQELLSCLKVLEELTKYQTEENIMFLRLRVTDEAVIKKLLIANVRSTHYVGYYIDTEKLPIGLFNGISSNEYFVTMPNGRELAWTESLSKYIEKYNVVPSREFLILFGKLINDCRDYYSPAAAKLEIYLEKHPLVLEDENSMQVVSKRM